MSRAVQKCDFAIERLIQEERLDLEDLAELRNWTRNEPKFARMGDEEIAPFLIACSGNVERTKCAIETNRRIKRENPAVFRNRDMQCKEVQKAASVLEVAEFSEQTPDGYSIYFGRISDPLYSNIDMEPCLKLVGMSLENTARKYPPKGVIVLLDMKNIGLMHLTRIKFSLLKPIFQYVQGGLNFKLIRVHIINTVYFLDKIMAIISPFLSAELVEILHFHPPMKDMEEFYRTCIPKNCLPEDYGGDLPSIRWFHENNMNNLRNSRVFFDEEEDQEKEEEEENQRQ